MPERRPTRRTVLRGLGALGAGTGMAATGTLAGCSLIGDSVQVAVPWSANELDAFRRVVDGLGITGYRVDLVPLGDNIDAAFGANDAGRPDVVLLPRLGLVRTYFERCQLVPMPVSVFDPRRPRAAWPYSTVWDDALFFRHGKDLVPYGLPFKVSDVSLIWYSKRQFARRGLRPPSTWEELIALVRDVATAAVPAFSIGMADGWMLGDLFANLVWTCAGPSTYRQLAANRISVGAHGGTSLWQNPSVSRAFEVLADLLRLPNAIAHGLAGSWARQFPDAVLDVFAYGRALMVPAPDFAESVIREFGYEDDAGVIPFPAVGSGPPPRVLAGDVAVLAAPASKAALDFVTRLARPTASLPWIERTGGFVAANTRVGPTQPGHGRTYSAVLERSAERLRADREGTAGFDLSDLLGSLGTDQGLWAVLDELYRATTRRTAGAAGASAAIARAASLRMDRLAVRAGPTAGAVTEPGGPAQRTERVGQAEGCASA